MPEESIEALRAERDHLANALADRSAQLQAVSKEFETFTQTLAHDLRAPLRAMEGFAQILLEDYGGKLDDDGKRCVETLASGARNASALIQELHGFARLCQRPFNPTVVDMKTLFGQTAEALTVEGATAQFQIGELPEAWGDLEMLGMIVEELIRNAVKFSKLTPNPSVQITGSAEQGRAVYSVRDNGIGFDPRYAGRLFGVFQRLHPDKAFEGRGIGLAKVQRLVNRHGGKIWAEGKLNSGAVFYFSLPGRPL